MVAVPTDMAVIMPLRTVTTSMLLLDQVTALFVAFSGRTVAVKVRVSSTRSVAVV
jgi:hypothetical protein